MGNCREFWGCYYLLDTIEISNIDCIRTIVSVQYTRYNQQISRFSCLLDAPPTIDWHRWNFKHSEASYVNRNSVSNTGYKDSVDVALDWQLTFEFTIEQKQILTLDYYHESRRSEKRKNFMLSSSAWQMRGLSW
jgi:murein tripeptide amidase MpaA